MPQLSLEFPAHVFPRSPPRLDGCYAVMISCLKEAATNPDITYRHLEVSGVGSFFVSKDLSLIHI